MSIRFWALCVPLVLTLAGCSSGNLAESGNKAAAGLLVNQVTGRIGKTAPQTNTAVTVTRAQLVGFPTPLIRITVEKSGIPSFLTPRQTNGAFITWFSPDNISITFRAGVVTASRGLGDDLFGVNAAEAIAVLEGRAQPGPAPRINRRLNGDGAVVKEPYTCDMEDRGPATITVLNVNHSVRHFREICIGSPGQFTNDYWQGGGVMWQSRQWFGASLGYMTFERLVN